MTYLALYRAWRPQLFSEVVGQEKTVTALRNAIKEGRLSHAYLFSGPRGTGKTSIAKIIARAVNCNYLQDGEPCNQCSSCQDISMGSFMDVIEIDAASNRGIDEIRDLREKVRILPAQGKKKVYIIDEVHMLTTEAFNALLKTIEEPPDSVVFILATTEAHKIPATILSRCQSYYFRRLTGEEISTRLQQVAAAGGMNIDPEALQLIARRANGGMRDALSSLDQIHSYKGNQISREDVQDVMGLVDDVFLGQLFDAVIAQDIAEIVSLLARALNQGKEAQQLARESALYMRDLLIYSVMGESGELAVVTASATTYLEKQKGLATRSGIIKALRKLMDAADRLRFSEGNRFQLEIALLELGTLLVDSTEAEEKPVAKPKKRTAPAAPVGEPPGNKFEAPDAGWNKILAGVKEKKIPTHALLAQGKLLGTKGNNVYIGYKKAYKFHKEKMEEKPNREILESVLQEVMGRRMEVQFTFLEEEKAPELIVQKAIEYFGEDKVDIKD